MGSLESNDIIKKLQELSKRLTQTESILSSFFNQAPGLRAIATKDGYFIKINHAWETALGWSAEEIYSKPYRYFIHPDDLIATEEAEIAMSNGSVIKGFRNRYRHKDGSYKIIEWQSSPYIDDSGLTYTVCSIVDEGAGG